VKRRIYSDTPVIGGCLDAEFEEWSVALFDDFKSGSAILVISDLTLFELEAEEETGSKKRRGEVLIYSQDAGLDQGISQDLAPSSV
jgi:hypothetical protein